MSESKTLDEILERLEHRPMGPNAPTWCEACSSGKVMVAWVPWFSCLFRAALIDAYDLGQKQSLFDQWDEAVSEERKAWEKAVEEARRGSYVDGEEGTVEGQMARAILAAREA